MKIISENKKTSIVLENNDILEVTALNKKNTAIIIKCLGETLHLEENTVSEEEKAIKAMEKYLKKEKMTRIPRKSRKSS